MAMNCKAIGLDYEVDPDPKNPTGQREYFVDGISQNETPNDVTVKVLQTAPLYLDIAVPLLTDTINSIAAGRIYRKNISNPKFIDATRAVATVKWGLLDSVPHPEVGGQKPHEKGGSGDTQQMGPEYSFDTHGGTTHITSLSSKMFRKSRVAVGLGANTAPDFGGAIGVSHDKVEGVDMLTGAMKWTLTIKGVPVTHEYRRLLASMSNPPSTNDETLFGNDPGELLFLGASGNFRAGDGWVVGFDYLEKPNLGQITVGGITFPDVGGHDYVWFVYKKTEISVDGKNVVFEKPVYGYVDRLYEPRSHKKMFEVQ